jgi:hypothetical protein
MDTMGLISSAPEKAKDDIGYLSSSVVARNSDNGGRGTMGRLENVTAKHANTGVRMRDTRPSK